MVSLSVLWFKRKYPHSAGDGNQNATLIPTSFVSSRLTTETGDKENILCNLLLL